MQSRKYGKSISFKRKLYADQLEEIFNEYKAGISLKEIAMSEKIDLNHLIKCLKKQFGENEIEDNTEKIEIKERHEFNKAEEIKKFRAMLADETIPIWKPVVMYKGIEKDKNLMSTENLALKYGTSITRIKAIIESELWKTV